MKAYTPIEGFYNLLDFDIPKKEFNAFVHVQNFLADWEEKRKRGYKVPDNVRDISAKYQQCLFTYERID